MIKKVTIPKKFPNLASVLKVSLDSAKKLNEVIDYLNDKKMVADLTGFLLLIDELKIRCESGMSFEFIEPMLTYDTLDKLSSYLKKQIEVKE